jgi:hypothetical protein
MRGLSYNKRIHKAKLSGRNLRYVLADQLARAFPPLQRRWQFPVESVPIAQAAEGSVTYPTLCVDGSYPPELTRLFPHRHLPAQITQNVFDLRDVTITGQAGAMIRQGRLLAVRPQPNWVSALRPRPHRLRKLDSERIYYNLISPLPARGHIFHWLFDFTLPLIAWLEQDGRGAPLSLLVNAERLAFQQEVLDVLLRHYPGLTFEDVGESDAVIVPKLKTSIFTPHYPRALQTEAASARLDALADGLATKAADWQPPARFFISREDARLRRVLNEGAVMERLAPHGFERVVLKGMPIPRQIRLFREAEAIVSPHGAGLAHLAWCRPGTKIFEVFPSPDGPRGRPRNATDNFWLISQYRKLRYDVSFGGPSLDRKDGFEFPSGIIEAITAKL